MKEDEVLAMIRERVLAERADDARWEALARGDLDPAARVDLERRAAEDPHVAAMLEACKPLGDDAEARIAARVAPLAPRRIGRIATFVAPLALAATLLIWWSAGRRGDDVLPSYDVTAVGEHEMRGPAAPSARLRLHGAAEARFDIVARPATAIHGRVVAYVFAMRGAALEPVAAEVELADGGSVRVRGNADALIGAVEIRLVLATPGAAPGIDAARELAKNPTATDPRRTVLVIAIDRE